MKPVTVQLNQVAYHLLRSTPQGVILLDSADDRLQSYARSFVAYLPDKKGFSDLTVFNEDGDEVVKRLPSIRRGYVTAYPLARITKLPDEFDSSKGKSYEITLNLSETVYRDLKTIQSWAIQNGLSYRDVELDNNFLSDWMLGSAIFQWLIDSRGQAIARESFAHIPSGEYVFDFYKFETFGYFYSVDKSAQLPNPRFDAQAQTEVSTKVKAGMLSIPILFTSQPSSNREASVDERSNKGKRSKQKNGMGLNTLNVPLAR